MAAKNSSSGLIRKLYFFVHPRHLQLTVEYKYETEPQFLSGPFILIQEDFTKLFSGLVVSLNNGPVVGWFMKHIKAITYEIKVLKRWTYSQYSSTGVLV